jgi:hypothetical protein
LDSLPAKSAHLLCRTLSCLRPAFPSALPSLRTSSLALSLHSPTPTFSSTHKSSSVALRLCTIFRSMSNSCRSAGFVVFVSFYYYCCCDGGCFCCFFCCCCYFYFYWCFVLFYFSCCVMMTLFAVLIL